MSITEPRSGTIKQGDDPRIEDGSTDLHYNELVLDHPPQKKIRWRLRWLFTAEIRRRFPYR